MEYNAKDFLGRPPGWLTRTGIMLVSGILTVVFLASFVIRYSDVTEAEIEVMPITPPVLLKTKRDGQISEFFVGAGDFVKPGDTIAKLKTVADYGDVLAIKKAVINRTTPEDLGLLKPTSIGSLQGAYSDYLKALYGIRTIENFYDNNIGNLLDGKTREIEGRAFSDVLNRLQNSKRNNIIIKQNHNRMETLFSKGVISKAELEKSQLEYNRSLQEINELSSNYSKDSYNTNEKFEGRVADMEIASLRVLSEISIWEDQFIFISPIEGKVFFMDVWSPFQSVVKGEELFGVSPNVKSPLMGMAKIPVHNFGKVAIGQKVIIKLHSFPYEEWGALEGSITEISKTPKRSDDLHYIAYIKMDTVDNKLAASISDKGNLSGFCDIVLKENTLFEKLFISTKKTLNNKR